MPALARTSLWDDHTHSRQPLSLHGVRVRALVCARHVCVCAQRLLEFLELTDARASGGLPPMPKMTMFSRSDRPSLKESPKKEEEPPAAAPAPDAAVVDAARRNAAQLRSERERREGRYTAVLGADRKRLAEARAAREAAIDAQLDGIERRSGVLQRISVNEWIPPLQRCKLLPKISCSPSGCGSSRCS